MGNDELFYTIGQRFTEERNRLKLSQRKLATQLATSSKTVIAYEKNETPPKLTALLLFWKLGADILYIITGERSEPVGAAENRPAYEVDRTGIEGGEVLVTTQADEDLSRLIALLRNDSRLLYKACGYVDGLISAGAADSSATAADAPASMITEHDFSSLGDAIVKSGTIA